MGGLVHMRKNNAGTSARNPRGGQRIGETQAALRSGRTEESEKLEVNHHRLQGGGFEERDEPTD